MILAIIQARMGSTRLPGKVLKELEGKAVILRVYERVKKCDLIDKVIVATTLEKADDGIELFCKNHNIPVFRGSEDDVLDRFYKCALGENIKDGDSIIRVTADCPLIDYKVIKNIVEFYKNNNYDYVSNTIIPTYPDGLDTEVFSFEALKKAWEYAEMKSEREHVTPYIKKNKNIFKVFNYSSENDYSDMRWTLDEEDDYVFISEIYGNFSGRDYFPMEDIIEYINKNPDILNINKSHIRDEGYLKSLVEDEKIRRD